jgi:hypothetical protein
MYILINQENLVLTASQSILYQDNGNPEVDSGMAYAKYMVKQVIEVSEIPSDFDEMKYFYTESGGFVLKQDWTDPNIAFDPIAAQTKMLELSESSNTTAEYMVDLDFRLSNIELGI